MNEECLLATSLQNIPHGGKKVTEGFFFVFVFVFFFKSYVINAVYKDNKQTNGKSSDYSFGVGHRYMLKTSLLVS